jgi:hypothetical protein
LGLGNHVPPDGARTLTRNVWYRTRALPPGTTGAREAGCTCPTQPLAEAWAKRREWPYRPGPEAILVTVADHCPVHKETPDGA